MLLQLSFCTQEEERRELLQMSDPQLADVARVCNRYPDIELNFDVVGGETVTAGEPVLINVFMDRSLPEGQELAPVHCPRYDSQPSQVLFTLTLLHVFCIKYHTGCLEC